MRIFLKKNACLIIGIIIFSILFLPYINCIPYLDGNINFAQSILFYSGGFDLYFDSFSSVHPPLKIALLSFLYSLFGANQFVFTIAGYLWGILGIISFYFLLKKIHPEAEKTGVLLLSVNPLFISVGIFGLTDYILTCLLLFTLFMYLSKKSLLFILGLCGIVLVKETGLLIITLFLVLEIIQALSERKKKLHKLFLYSIPFLIYYAWDIFLKNKGAGAWKDWIFTDTASQGTFYTIINNIITLRIFNEYAAQHFLQLLFLNFNWMLISISTVATIFYFSKKENRKKFLETLLTFDQKSKAIIFIIMFCLSYSLTVLTLQTYTIPRYALPLIPFLILWFSISVSQLKNYYVKTIFIFTVFIFSVVALFLSVDPIANMLWGRIDVLGQKLYATNYHLSGNDGLTYNYQYLLTVRERTKILQGKIFPLEYCPYIFPDPNNDRITVNILDLSQSSAAKVCGLKF